MKDNDKLQHRWIQFFNPRNQTVSVTACAHCGKVKSEWSEQIRCVAISKYDHPMLRLGWQQLSRARVQKGVEGSEHNQSNKMRNIRATDLNKATPAAA